MTSSTQAPAPAGADPVPSATPAGVADGSPSGVTVGERIPRVAHRLPPGERLLWTGQPESRLVARHVFGRKWLIAYLVGMLAWWVARAMGPAPEFAPLFLSLLVLCGIPVLVFETFAVAVARTSRYAITDKRLVLKLGVVFPMTLNIPYRLLASAAIKRFADGSGQIACPLVEGQRIPYIALWPHCRPFRLNQPVPMLIGLEHPEHVAALLQEAALRQEDVVRGDAPPLTVTREGDAPRDDDAGLAPA